MRKENAEAISCSLGRVECVEESGTGDCRGRCMRVRVSTDIRQPLCRGRIVNIGGSSPQWIYFQHERLPIFCYWCGMLNHDERDCKLWLNGNGTLRKEDQQYGQKFF